MLFDIHNHTTFSRDAADKPEDIIKNAAANHYDTVGISDHNYYITGRYDEYRQEIYGLKEKYRGIIRVLCGMEVSHIQPDGICPADLSEFDYCLYEYFSPEITLTELSKIRKKYECPFGIAHFDLYEAGLREGVDAARLLAENDIFWELNVNHDRAHHYRTLEYVQRFTESPELAGHAKECGLRISVGYDTHILEDYEAHRVVSACEFLKSNHIQVPEFVKSKIRQQL